MIFSDSKLTSKRVLVRFYYWMDPNMGYGDGGTYVYANIPLKYFKEVEKQRHPSVGGSYFTYELDIVKGEEITGKKYWTMELGYGLGDNTNEVNELTEQLNRLSTVKEIN